MTEPDRSPPGDALTQRYREASAQDTRRPGAHVRDAVRAHAQMVITARKAPTAGAATPTAPAANQSRWKISALAGLALAGLTGLLVLQYDRGTDEEKDIAFGQRSASVPPAPATAPSTPSAPPVPMAADAAAPQAAQADSRSAKARLAESPPAIPKAPTAPVAKKPAPPPSISGSTEPTAEAEAARPPPPGPAPSQASPAPPAPEIAATWESQGLEQSARQAGSAVGGFVASPAPAAAAPAAAAPEEKRERFSASTSPLRKEAPGILKLADALQNAARAGNLPQVERLLQQGAALNAGDAAGRTPLILAAMQGHTAVVQRLLAAGANTALIDHDGFNALQHARRQGFDGIAHLIEAAR